MYSRFFLPSVVGMTRIEINVIQSEAKDLGNIH